MNNCETSWDCDFSIAVVLPAFNAERFLSAAIDSVLGQTLTNFTLVVIDDGSTDRTTDILRAYRDQDERVRLIEHENWGIVRSLNQAIESTSVGWIARMDADDVMEPNRLERQIAFAKAHPGLALTSCLVRYINEHGKVLGESVSDLLTDESIQAVRDRGDLVEMSHPGALIRRDVFEEIGGYRAESWPSEDIDLFNRIADAGYRVLVQPEHLLRYRIHLKSVTGETLRMDGTLHSWLEECSQRRRRGESEPTMEAFVQGRRQQPLLRRIDTQRRSRAWMLYRRATFEYSIGRRGATFLLVACSSLLNPFYSPLQVWRKYLRPRLSGFVGAERASSSSGAPRSGR